MKSEGSRGFEISALVAAAHELKAPLVLLRQLSLQLGEADDPAEVAEIARRIRLTSERSLRLVNGLSKSARLEDAMFKLEPIVVNNVVSEVIEEVRPLSEAMGQKIELKTRRKITAVGHFELIRTILLGLLDNSLMAGGRDKNRIEVKIHERGENLLISVRDFGETIENSRFRAIFSDLGRAAVSMADRPLSSGLGLFIASKFTEYMHGELSATRHHRGGVSFNVLLPRSRQLELF